MTKRIADTQKNLDAIFSEMSQQSYDNENEMITKLTNQKKEQEDRLFAELKKKNNLLNKEFEMEVMRLEGNYEQHLARINRKKNTEEEKIIRTNNMNTELGKD